MRFHAALAEHESTPHAADALLADAQAAGFTPDVAFCFATAHHAGEADALFDALAEHLNAPVVGCTAEGVIGPDREVERAPAVALMLARLPGVRVHSFHVPRDDWRPLFDDREGLCERLGAGPDTRCLLAFGDPFTTPTLQLLPLLTDLCPGVPVIGGMASAAQQPGENVLFAGDRTTDQGLVGVSLSGGPLAVQSVVSQGCRPFGKTFVVTKSHDNVIEQLGGRPALVALRDAIMELPPSERMLLQNGLFVGRAISEYKDTFGRGDFLVRGVSGVDNDTGAVTIGDYVRTGQTIRFHVRDAATATEDLGLLLGPDQVAPPPPAGALLFSCNGRGTRLFDRPNHDVAATNRAMPGTPVAGFFAAGELGPIGAQNFIHGHTASFALFRPG
jgi:small ligand-binding sensory domain FIST